jgi:hypothetical protein
VCQASLYYDHERVTDKEKTEVFRKSDGWVCTLWINGAKVYEKLREKKGKFFIVKGSCLLGSK